MNTLFTYLALLGNSIFRDAPRAMVEVSKSNLSKKASKTIRARKKTRKTAANSRKRNR